MQNSKRTDINQKKQEVLANQKQYGDTNKEKIRACAKDYKRNNKGKSEKETAKTLLVIIVAQCDMTKFRTT